MTKLAMEPHFDLARDADLASLLGSARAFHREDGHPLDADGKAAIARVTRAVAGALARYTRASMERGARCPREERMPTHWLTSWPRS